MADRGGGEGFRKLDETPTWAVAGVCSVIIIISILLENFLHKFGTWLTKRHKKALYEALEKVKTELMVLGFISLLLVFSQYFISQICVPPGVAHSMLPCHRIDRRALSASDGHGTEPSCKEGRAQLISGHGLDQLHILIFFLAVFHVIYSAVTMALGRLKIRGWKEWEQEASSLHDANAFKVTSETPFVKSHTSFWTRTPILFYIGCFFRQFFRSVNKSDYLALRNGFITVHFAPGSKFNFQKYIKRSLEDDFKRVVGVSPVLWTSFVVYLLLNVEGLNEVIWGSLIPVFIILAVGTKLQAILASMAIEISHRHSVIQGTPLVQASDSFFWFGNPDFVLHLIHFALFQNSFQITYSFWIWYEFRSNSCFLNDIHLLIVKLALGVGVLLLCTYITLPLYALITQMGSHMKKSIFDEQTSKALKNWRMAVKKKTRGKSSIASTLHSAKLSLYRFKTIGHSSRAYGTFQDDDRDEIFHDLENDDPMIPMTPHGKLSVTVDHQSTSQTGNEDHK